jgi:uncharacterized protein YfdQ (DUF2303 family)
MAENSDMQAVIDAARLSEAPESFDRNGDLVFVPQTKSFVSLEQFASAPLRKRGSVTVFDAASLNMVIADNADAGNVVIYLDRDLVKPRIVAVLNDCGAKGAGWRDFRAEIAFRQTPQWQKWRGIDNKMMEQAEFANFIEDNLSDIASPAGATMLEIVTYLEATRTVNFKSAIRLSSGAIQFQNSEDVEAKVGAGKIEVPETFELGIAPFLGSPSYSVPTRFRYRIKDGKLMLGIKMQRIEDLMQKLIDDVVKKIEVATNVSMIEGVAPGVISA